MGKRTIVLLTIVGIALTVGYLAFVPPKTAKPENEELYSALASAGIDEALVDVTDDIALVRYNLPEGRDEEAVTYFVLGAAAGAAPHTGKIIVQSYSDSTPISEVTANTGDILALTSKDDLTPGDWERFRKNMEVER